jgi:hypothetical protein
MLFPSGPLFIPKTNWAGGSKNFCRWASQPAGVEYLQKLKHTNHSEMITNRKRCFEESGFQYKYCPFGKEG